MRMGTKTLLFGCHQFLLHPFFTWLGWRALYGPPPWRMWFAFVLHDIGYWGMEDGIFDGPEDMHPARGALFVRDTLFAGFKHDWQEIYKQMVRHSRHMSERFGVPPSQLCWADKMGTAIMPSLLWAILAHLSGEGWIYIANGYGYEESHPRTLRGLVRFHHNYRSWCYSYVWTRRIKYEVPSPSPRGDDEASGRTT